MRRGQSQPGDVQTGQLGARGVGGRGSVKGGVGGSMMEAATGFEPVIRALQARALPLGYAAFWPPPSGYAVEEA